MRAQLVSSTTLLASCATSVVLAGGFKRSYRRAVAADGDVPVFSNPAAADFAVNTSALPGVDFDAPPSWAGNVAITPDNSTGQSMYFWYFPSTKTGGSDVLTIYLGGGPGCSSIANAFSTSPVKLQKGSPNPVQNPNAYTAVSDMLWVDQPIGTGYDVGEPSIGTSYELADQFYGFLNGFYGTFSELTNKTLYFVGGSYAGYYIPYIASRIVNASDKEKADLPLKVGGLQMSNGIYQSGMSAYVFMAHYAQDMNDVLDFSDDFLSSLKNTSQACGFEDTVSKVTYPPAGKIWDPLVSSNKPPATSDCDMYTSVYKEIEKTNECAIWQDIRVDCDTPGVNDTTNIVEQYVNQDAFKAVMHAPAHVFHDCLAQNPDGSWPTVFPNAPNHIDQGVSPWTQDLMEPLLDTVPITLVHGKMDIRIPYWGDRLMIQNSTWQGTQGFQAEPNTPLVFNGKTMGLVHSERDLTYIEVEEAGHGVGHDQPELSFALFKSFLGLEPLPT